MNSTISSSDHTRSRNDQAAIKLQNALHRLIVGSAVHPQNQSAIRRYTVAALSREAGVSRNTIYTNHRSYVDQLARLGSGDVDHSVCKNQQNKEQLLHLHRLATENACLLKRAIDAEHRVDRLERRCASLLRQLDSAMSISVISKQQS